MLDSIESLVVPDIGPVMTLFVPYNKLYKVDLPTLGCPTIVILIVSKPTSFLVSLFFFRTLSLIKLYINGIEFLLNAVIFINSSIPKLLI